MATPPVIAPPVDVTLSLFGGMDTEISPADCPEGLSPDNQDLIFLPGATQSRPCLAKLLNPSLGAVSVVYEKTYVKPNGDPLTMILTSDGKLWVEDVNHAPGTAPQIGSTAPGLYAHSVSAFGAEYIAVSDLLHGQGVPLQYDGTNLDRVTQDGPGEAPTVAEITYACAIASGAPQALAITAISDDANGVVTVTTSSSLALLAGFAIGSPVLLAGVATAGYNGLVTVDTHPTANSFTCKIAAAGLGPDTTGQVITGLNVQFTTPAGVSPASGDPVTITGTGAANFDNNVNGNPASYTVATVLPPVGGHANVLLSIAGFAPVGSGIPTALFGNPVAGTLTLGGNSSPGQYQCVQMFLTRSGYLTKPSPPAFVQAGGGQKLQVSNLAIGPSNVVARVLGFTAANGGNFFVLLDKINLPNPVPGATGPIVFSSTVVADNTSTSATVDFADNTLLAGTAIDVAGNDLFDQVVLGPVAGFFAFASRLIAWGDYNKVENFLNLGMGGGYLSGVLTRPLGWGMATAGGLLVNGGAWAGGMSWQITGDGTNNPKGQIQQGAHSDYLGNTILSPATQYDVRLWIQASATNLAGNLIVDFYSATQGGQLAIATIPCSSLTVAGGFSEASFNGPTPASLPEDTVLRVYVTGLPAGATVTLAEIEIIFTTNPYRTNLARVSYALNPEGFALTTGNLGPADDDSPLRCFTRQRNAALLETAEGVHTFQDNLQEPDQWPVNSLSQSIGAVSLRAGDAGKFGTGDAAEDWTLIASKNGLFLFSGADFWKVSQEMSKGAGVNSAPTWDDINWAYQHTVWVKNDPGSRRAYIGVPIGTATAPNLIFILDYREMDTATQIAGALPIHITLAGKMKSSDLTRKWTRWNLTMNCGEVLVRPGNQRMFCLGSGTGQTPALAGHGNIYTLDPSKLTDDDYGAMNPYYTTFAFVDHDQEQGLQLGSGRHLYRKVCAFATGVGLVSIIPLINSLQNPLPATSPRLLSEDADESNAQAADLEWTVGIRGQRVFFRVQVAPLPGTTDVKLNLQKLIVRMMKDPVALFRSSEI